MENNQKWENLPEELKKEGLFCTHTNKIPNARTNDKSTFKTFDDVIKERKEAEGVGIGIFDNLCGIDIDHCINEKGEISEEAKDIINTFNSYTERSYSGTGIHILFKCENQVEIDSDKYYMNNRPKGIELYQGNITNKFFTCTGDKISGEYATINPEVIKKFNEKYMKKPEMIQPTIQKSNQNTSSEDYKTDREYLEIGLQKDVKLQSLLRSTPSGSGGNESETDLQIMCKLAYWTNRNEVLMNEAFIQSSYFGMKDTEHQKKWNNRRDYSQETIRKAIQQITRTARDDNQSFIEERTRKEEEKKEESFPEDIIEKMLKEKQVANRIDSFFQESESGRYIPIPSGFNNLDDVLNGGFQKQSLVVIGGGSGMGKTTFAINLALNFTLQGKKVIYYSLEMSEQQIFAKVFSNSCYMSSGKRISADRFFRLYDENIMTQEAKKEHLETIKSNKNLENLFVIHDSNSLNELEMKVDSFNKYFRNKGEESPIVIVDYLQYLQGNPKEDVQSLIKRATAYFKKYVLENDSLCIILTANNRVSTEEKKKTSFSGGRDSSDIEYSSDYNFQINFAEWETFEGTEKETGTLHSLQQLKATNPKEISLTLHKSRMGTSGTISVFNFNGMTNTFEPISMEEYQSNRYYYYNKQKRNRV